jgi:hypothetical protein
LSVGSALDRDGTTIKVVGSTDRSDGDVERHGKEDAVLLDLRQIEDQVASIVCGCRKA